MAALASFSVLLLVPALGPFLFPHQRRHSALLARIVDLRVGCRWRAAGGGVLEGNWPARMIHLSYDCFSVEATRILGLVARPVNTGNPSSSITARNLTKKPERVSRKANARKQHPSVSLYPSTNFFRRLPDTGNSAETGGSMSAHERVCTQRIYFRACFYRDRSVGLRDSVAMTGNVFRSNRQALENGINENGWQGCENIFNKSKFRSFRRWRQVTDELKLQLSPRALFPPY